MGEDTFRAPSTKDELDQTKVRAAIEAFLVALRVAKCQYFFTLILSADCCPAALFWVTQALLVKGHLRYFCSYVEEFVQHLWDKITQICSQVDAEVAGLE